MRLRSVGLSLALVAAALGLSSQAQEESDEGARIEQLPDVVPEDAIVVTGRRTMTEERFEEAVEDFVRELGRPGPIGQISRWGEPLCPTTQGLSPEFNAFVSRRLVEIAANVGAPGPADCGEYSNTLIVFTPEPERFLDNVKDDHPGLLGYHFIGQRRSVARFQPPMKSWYVTMTQIPGAYQAIDYAYGPSPPAGTGSRIKPHYKSRFAFILIVVDAATIEGQSIGPVADRIAMLALSNSSTGEGCEPLPSIMDFLDTHCPAGQNIESITEYDEAFLTELYSFDRDELRGYMRHTISKAMMEELGPP